MTFKQNRSWCFLVILTTWLACLGCNAKPKSELSTSEFNKQVQDMFSTSWTDGFSDPKVTLDFYDRGLRVQEKGFGERWIRINWKDSSDVGKWLVLQDRDTLHFKDEHSEVTLRSWRYWSENK